MESTTFHFDLSHLEGKQDFTLKIGRQTYPVQAHTLDSRKAAQKENAALARIADRQLHRFTHFASVPQADLPTKGLRRISVTFPSEGGQGLPRLALVFLYSPEAYRRRHREQKFKGAAPALHPKLQHYGVGEIAAEDMTEVSLAADQLPSPYEVAQIIVGMHPELAASNPYLHTIILDDHIIGESGSTQNSNLFQFANQIAMQGANFAPVAQSKDVEGNGLTWGYDAGDNKAGDPVMIYTLSDTTANGAKAPTAGALQSSKDDMRLQNATWAVNQGQTVVQELQDQGGSSSTAQASSSAASASKVAPQDSKAGSFREAAAKNSQAAAYSLDAKVNPRSEAKGSSEANLRTQEEASRKAEAQSKAKTRAQTEANPKAESTNACSAIDFDWTLNQITDNLGLRLDPDSLHFDSNCRFSIEAKNTFLRSLGAYVEFLDEGGNPISNPEGWEDYFSEAPQLQEWFETDSKKFLDVITATNTVMGIPMPTNPTTLSFPWPDDATTARLLFGGLGSYGWDPDVDWPGIILTGIFQYGVPMIFLLADTIITNTAWYNSFEKEVGSVIATLAVSVPIMGLQIVPSVWNGDVKTILSSLADAIAGILASLAMQPLMLHIAAAITTEEAVEEIPFVGWALRVASVLMDAEEMIVTTAELYNSPLTIETQVKRTFELDLTMHADPAHGIAGQPDTAVWPATSDHWVCTVQYKGGTYFQAQGPMPATTSSEAIQVNFSAMPAGGSMQILFAVYSENNWVAGQWQSHWLDAMPTNGDLLSLEDNITENLVPLTLDTQYFYKEKIVYDPNQSAHVWSNAAAPTALAPDLDCSAGTNALCKPVNLTLNQSCYEVGYTWQSNNLGVNICGSSSEGSGNYAMQNLSVLGSPESGLKYVTCSFEEQPFITYDQLGPIPTDGEGNPTISQQNFILDSRNGGMHLRQVILENGSDNFGLNAEDLQSWGQFSLPHMDDFVVHPSGLVIGVSWENHKMQILQLPYAPTDDANAAQAQPASGMGLRQGLLNGPKSLTISPDGRILVLETRNERIQAFDTNGNPVPHFNGPQRLSLDSSYSSDLDAGQFTAPMQMAFQAAGINALFDLDASLQSDLDAGTMNSNIWQAFYDQGINLTTGSDDPSQDSQVRVDASGSQWTITDPAKNQQYTIHNRSGVLTTYNYMTAVQVSVLSQGSQWIVKDLDRSNSWNIQSEGAASTSAGTSSDVTSSEDAATSDNSSDATSSEDAATPENSSDAATLSVKDYLSFMPLHNPDGADLTYMDVATESKSYLYVLAYENEGANLSDYFVDIYQPDGTWMVRTPDPSLNDQPEYVNAAKMVVDVWRNMYVMGYGSQSGSGGRTEPIISHWIPSPPLFSLPFSEAEAFNSGDMGTITADFSAHGIQLSGSATVTTVASNGHWQVNDPSSGTTYDVIQSGDQLQVYAL